MYSFLEKQYDKIKPYLFQYKNDFFVFPNTNNSPQLIWQSLKKMPFVKFDPLLNMAESDTPFLSANFYYQDLEEELVIFYTSIHYKKNVHYKKLFSEKYYCLTGFLSQPSEQRIKTIIDDVHFEGQLWVLHKPGAIIKDYHFKDSRAEYISIFFTDKWLNKYLQLFPDGNESLTQIIASNNNTISYTGKVNEMGMELLQKTHTSMQQPISEARTNLLQQHVYAVIDFFKTDCLNETVSPKYLALSNADRLKLIEVEQILKNSIYKKFPGIGSISQEIGFSETKLKALFKDVHETTLLDYFQCLQMTIAKDLLLQNKLKVADVASMFGYENASKFAATFKIKMNQLPSEINKTEI
jgi:AraC-like DNA-binding protein